MSIQFAELKDFPQIRALWDLCFPEEPVFNLWFFDRIFKLQNTIIFRKNKELCAMLQIFPYKLKLGHTIYPVHYIYGACTHPDYRNKGIMGSLLNFACNNGKYRGDFASILIPQNKPLFDLYEKYGYKPNFYVNKFSRTPCGTTDSTFIREAVVEDIERISSLYERGTLDYEGFIIRDPSYWLQQFKMFHELDGKVYLLERDKDCLAYGFVSFVENQLFVQEAIGISKEAIISLVDQVSLKEKYSSSSVLTSNFLNGDRIPLGCIKFLQKNRPTEFCGYMNLMFN